MEKIIDNNTIQYDIKRENGGITIVIDSKNYFFEKVEKVGDQLYLRDNAGKNYKVFQSPNHFSADGISVSLESAQAGARKKSGAEGEMISPMPGKITSVLVSEGEKVTKGQKLIIMEAMKMEHTIIANKDGVVEKINCSDNDQVEGDFELIVLS